MAEYGSHFWSLANAITAFSIAQVIGILIALGQYPYLVSGVAKATMLVFFLSLIFTVLYGFAVYWCYCAEVAFLKDTVTEVQREWLWRAMLGRLVAIVLFGLAFWVGVWSGTSEASALEKGHAVNQNAMLWRSSARSRTGSSMRSAAINSVVHDVTFKPRHDRVGVSCHRKCRPGRTGRRLDSPCHLRIRRQPRGACRPLPIPRSSNLGGARPPRTPSAEVETVCAWYQTPTRLPPAACCWKSATRI